MHPSVREGLVLSPITFPPFSHFLRIKVKFMVSTYLENRPTRKSEANQEYTKSNHPQRNSDSQPASDFRSEHNKQTHATKEGA